MHRSSSQPCGDTASCPRRLAQLEVSPSPNKPAIPETSVAHQQASSSHRTPQTLKTATHGLSYSHQQVTPVPEQLPWDLVLLTSRLALNLRTVGPSASHPGTSGLVPTMGMWILKPATQGLGPTNNQIGTSHRTLQAVQPAVPKSGPAHQRKAASRGGRVWQLTGLGDSSVHKHARNSQPATREGPVSP